MDLRGFLKDVPDFPEPGIIFKDISPLLADPDAFAEAVECMSAPFCDMGITAVAGIDSRGFLFGPSIAQKLDSGFVMIRKAGKLPGATIGVDYDLEYGSDRLEMVDGVIDELDRVLLIDDVLATGGTLGAAFELMSAAGAKVAGVSVLVDLVGLNGRSKLPDVPLHAQIEVN